MHTYVDSYHVVHMDMCVHTVGVSNVGIRILTAKLSKQMMNSIISKKSEMTGNSEYLTCNIWYDNFLEAQGYPMKSNILWQDNEAAEIVAKNGNM